MIARVVFESGPDLALLFGFREENLRQIESSLGVAVAARGNEVTVRGSKGAVQSAARVLERMRRAGRPITPQDVREMLNGERARVEGGDPVPTPSSAAERDETIRTPRRRILPRGVRQAEYVRAIRTRDVVFGVGPAGTGKTYLAVGCALEAYGAHTVDRIVLARPVVEAGERLGFLPGDVQEKVHPYMRPLYDALAEMLEPPALRRLLQQEIIEIAPLAYMRGRTLNKAFIILDEAQNTTVEQMKMFLTRMGEGSRAVVTGDITQIDLPPETMSGFVNALDVLANVEGLSIVRFGPEDVVRHELVQRILESYERAAASGRPSFRPGARPSRP
jgi:phosphate starvation-inducible PhoH-like protein